jgi:hypothetical protein
MYTNTSLSLHQYPERHRYAPQQSQNQSIPLLSNQHPTSHAHLSTRHTLANLDEHSHKPSSNHSQAHPHCSRRARTLRRTRRRLTRTRRPRPTRQRPIRTRARHSRTRHRRGRNRALCHTRRRIRAHGQGNRTSQRRSRHRVRREARRVVVLTTRFGVVHGVCTAHCLFLDGVGSDECWLGVGEECGAGLCADNVFEGLALDGVDVDAGGG